MIPASIRSRSREEREGRRRDDADDVDVDAEARRAGDDGRDEHVPRAAGVLADDDGCTGLGQPTRRRPAEGVGRGRPQVDIGDATDAVRAEQSSHRVARPAEAARTRPVTVTGTCGGLAATSVTPGGRVAPTVTSLVPGRESRDVEVGGEGRADDPVKVGRCPPTVRRTRSMSTSYVEAGRAPMSADPDLERPGRGHGADADRDLDLLGVEWRRRRSAGRGSTSTVCVSEKPPIGDRLRIDGRSTPADRRRRLRR